MEGRGGEGSDGRGGEKVKRKSEIGRDGCDREVGKQIHSAQSSVRKGYPLSSKYI